MSYLSERDENSDDFPKQDIRTWVTNAKISFLPEDAEHLIALAHDRSAAGRANLADIVSALLQNSGPSRQNTLISDILLKLVKDAELDLRCALSKKLAQNESAPRDLMAFLAHDQIEVAEPILVLSRVLGDQDLIDIIRQCSTDHRCAVARRPELDAKVQEVLVLSHDCDAIKTMLGNETIMLADHVLSMLSESARQVEELRSPLVERPEVTTEFAIKLYWWVSLELRNYIQTRFKVSRSEIDQALESTLQSMLESHFKLPHVTPEMMDVARHLVQSGKVSSGLLIQVLRRGQITPFLALFSALLDLPAAAVEFMIISHSGETMALAAKALKIIKPDFASLFLLARAARPVDHKIDPKELSRVLGFYDRLPLFMAEAVLARWRAEPASLQQKNFDLAHLIVETNQSFETVVH